MNAKMPSKDDKQSVTGWMPHNGPNLKFCEGVVESVNRMENRNARIKFDAYRTKIRVLDDAIPIYAPGGKISGWARP